MNEARMKMELHKVLREIQMHGTEYTFFRKKVDKYGEPTKEEPEQIANVKGLFHVSKGYITQNIQDGTKTHSKGQPMLMVAYENTREIQTDDFLIINENTYKVVEKNNIQEYNIVTDISLELVLDGRN
jgi:hypothetical protein